VTARADGGCDYDFVSRFFAPRVGVTEDPVTGSAHTVLAPYWAAKLGRTALVGFQASRRGGRIGVEVVGDRVALSGRAVLVIDGLLAADVTASMAVSA
jgi:predicted PhzF superfamily epimerase YddE/YHI9